MWLSAAHRWQTAWVAFPTTFRFTIGCPWADLLARSTVVLTQGGTSSTLDPLGFGLPLVMIPLGADHFTNARMVSRSGAAVVLDARQYAKRGTGGGRGRDARAGSARGASGGR